jgi:hypothetical protein
MVQSRDSEFIPDQLRLAAEEFSRKAPLLPTQFTPEVSKRAWPEQVFSVHETLYRALGFESVRPHVKKMSDSLYDPAVWRDSSAAEIERNARAYEKVIDPIFRMSIKVSIIDQHLRTKYYDKNNERLIQYRGYLPTLEKFIELAAKHRRVREISFYVGKSSLMATSRAGVPWLREDLNLILNKFGLAERLNVTLHDLDNIGGSHARYIIGHTGSPKNSWTGGIKFDHGFDVADSRSKQRTQPVIWLSRALLDPLANRFL